jgi:hypothetical protein
MVVKWLVSGVVNEKIGMFQFKKHGIIQFASILLVYYKMHIQLP